ncbi:MAG TPA: ABC transporter permease [Phycisphaerae bacterium]|nr:ABC transporter permease [Phycisphaerae bacterium]
MPSPAALALRRFTRHPPAVVGLIILLVMAGACFGTIPWTKNAYADQHQLQHVKQPPSREFPLGTDPLGRDLTARFLLGGAISLSIGIASALIAVLIGASVGLVAGYAGGRTDAFLMRVVDVMYGLPYILLVILMRVAFVEPLSHFLARPDAQGHATWFTEGSAATSANVLVLLIGIGAVSWLTMARVIRGQVLSLRDQPFVEAARAIGLPPHRILLRHILPNLLGTIIVYGTLTVPNAILSESFLSFLGLGIQDPLPSWGNLAAQGIDAMNPVYVRWWLITWPCVGLSLTLLSLNFLGDALREALAPRRS